MSKRSDGYYFQGFIEYVKYGYQATKMPEDDLNHFDTGLLQDKLDELHRIEHDAGKKKHEIMAMLIEAFIIPIEWEDIILLSQSINEMTDKIEDVLIRIYTSNVQQIRPEVLTFIEVTIHYCEALKGVMEEFADFRRSKTPHGLIIEINALEEEGDRLFIESMHKLHAEVTNPIEIITWREIYMHLEKCCDVCEYVADVVGSVVMRNT